MKKTILCGLILGLSLGAVQAEQKLSANIALLDPIKGDQVIGTIDITESPYGLVFAPHLDQLSPGLHGFHLHQNPSCEAKEKDGKLTAGLGAGGHYDPHNKGKHGFAWSDDAHLGDLPALFVDSEGKADYPVLAPRLKTLDQVKNLSVMIHQGGDNHADQPKALGGGGARMACGVIK